MAGIIRQRYVLSLDSRSSTVYKQIRGNLKSKTDFHLIVQSLILSLRGISTPYGIVHIIQYGVIMLHIAEIFY